jgi:hypothetical protein
MQWAQVVVVGRDENRCVRYGDVVCLKSPAAKER